MFQLSTNRSGRRKLYIKKLRILVLFLQDRYQKNYTFSDTGMNLLSFYLKLGPKMHCILVSQLR